MADVITPKPEHKHFLFYRAIAPEADVVNFCKTQVHDWFGGLTDVNSADFWFIKGGGLLIVAVAVDDDSGTDWSGITGIEKFLDVSAGQLRIAPQAGLEFRR